MIDFRFHLISLVAVILALALGILVGSGFLGDPLLDDLERRVGNVTKDNDELRALAGERRRELERAEAWARAVEPYLVRGALAGTSVVIFRFDRADGDMIAAVEDGIERADGTVATAITFSERLAISNSAERDELALVLRSASADEEELRVEAARQLGTRVADVAKRPPRDAPRPSDDLTRLEAFLGDLEDAGFIAIDQRASVPVPPGSVFVVAGGGRDPAPFDLDGFTTALTVSLAGDGADVVAVEPRESAWPIVESVRADGAAREAVSTVDSADSVTGRIALVLSLSHRDADVVGHYGFEDGATDPVPAPDAT